MFQINGVALAPAPQWLIDLATNDKPKESTTNAHKSHLSLVDPADRVLDASGDASQMNYVRAGFDKELEYLKATQPGAQSHQLNKSAFKIGTLVGTGLLSYNDAEIALLQTALGFTNESGKERWSETNALPQIRSGLTAGQKRPRALPEANKKVILRGRAARAFIRGAKPEQAQVEAEDSELEAAAEAARNGEELDEGELDDSGVEVSDNGPYGVQYGRTLFVSVRTNPRNGETTTSHHRMADFAAHIAEEIYDEDGNAIFRIEGRTRRGKPFDTEIEADNFQDAKQLLAKLSNVVGASCVFYAGMEKHLPAAIRSFSPEQPRSRRFTRVGWRGTGDSAEFIIPGREKPDTSIVLGQKLAYSISSDADATKGIAALESLIKAQKRSLTTVALSTFFQAPLAHLCGWREERYGLFISGRTGSFKSSWSLLAMALYGEKFASEDQAIKFGIGATNNSIMGNMAGAGDMPLLVDNYKPNTGYGAKDLINLIQMVMEGSEKDRLNRDSKQRSTRTVHAWPIFTGEAVPDDDAATIARLLVIPFPYLEGHANADLSHVQNECAHLNAVGGGWLEWLHSAEARQAAQSARLQFLRRRSYWCDELRKMRSDMVNINRVASNLASNEATWETMLACPFLKPLAFRYAADHAAGLLEVAHGMSQHTAQAFEATRYLDAIRALLDSGRAYLSHRANDPEGDSKKICLGWEDDRGVYLIPSVAFVEAGKMGENGFNGIGKNTIHKQLAQIHALADNGKDGELTVLRRCGGGSGKPVRVLHLKAEAIHIAAAENEE